MKRRIMAGLAIAITAAVTLPAATASAHGNSKLSLAEVLLSDSKWDDANGFDYNPYDFDIVTQAVLLFPDLVTAASEPGDYTVFLPTDQAFRRLVKNLTGKWVHKEADVFDAVAGLGADTVKAVLTYHIIAGVRIDFATAKQSDGAELGTLNGATITVDVRGKYWKTVVLMDKDPDLRDPRVVWADIKASNGIAHAIDRVLLPINV
jgi:uncharacterized surface protein with fasciclin (FAS1) repeats